MSSKKNKISQNLRLSVFDKFNGSCAYCGCAISTDSFDVDHIKPSINGGSNELENMNPACKSCNSSKQDWDIERFRLIKMISISSVSGIINAKQWIDLLNAGVFINLPVYKFHYEEVAFEVVQTRRRR